MGIDERTIASDRVRRFRDCYGEPHHLLACHAAFCLVITPELLGHLRNRFLRGVTPWIAEADLLLSELCEEVGYEQYVIGPAEREILVGALREEYPGRQQEVASLLLTHLQRLPELNRQLSSEEIETQRLSAMLLLDEQRDSAIRRLAESFQRIGGQTPGQGRQQSATQSESELARLVRVTEMLSPQLAHCPELLNFSRDVAELLMGIGTSESPRTSSATGVKGPVVAGVSLPLAVDVVSHTRGARRRTKKPRVKKAPRSSRVSAVRAECRIDVILTYSSEKLIERVSDILRQRLGKISLDFYSHVFWGTNWEFIEQIPDDYPESDLVVAFDLASDESRDIREHVFQVVHALISRLTPSNAKRILPIFVADDADFARRHHNFVIFSAEDGYPTPIAIAEAILHRLQSINPGLVSSIESQLDSSVETNWLIDGYNVMHAFGLVPEDQSARRRALRRFIDLIHETLGDESKTTVVFDGPSLDEQLVKTAKARGIQVRFAVGRNADELIEELVEQLPAKHHCNVVSADHYIQRIANRRKCGVLEPLEYATYLERRFRQPNAVDAVARHKAPPPSDEVQEWVRSFAGSIGSAKYWLENFPRESPDSDQTRQSREPDSPVETQRTVAWYRQGLEVAQAVARIETHSRRGMGTGFLVRGADLKSDWKDEGVLLTCHHVFGPRDDDLERKVGEMLLNFTRLSSDSESVFKIEEVVAQSGLRGLDFVLARVVPSGSRLDRVSLSAEPPILTLNQRVRLIGHVRAGAPTLYFQDATIVGFDDPFIHFELDDRVDRGALEPGSSGSPIFDENWSVVGMLQQISGSAADVSSTGVAVSIGAIIEFLKATDHRSSAPK